MNTPRKRKSVLLGEVLAEIDPKEKTRTAQRMAIAVQLVDALTEKGWTKKQFADVMGKSPSEITKWLSGTNNFTVDTLCDIQEVLGMNFFSAEQQPVVETKYVPFYVPMSTFIQSHLHKTSNVGYATGHIIAVIS